MENCFKSTLTQVAQSIFFQTNAANAFCGKRFYCPPSAKCIEMGTMAIMAGSNPQGSGAGGWKDDSTKTTAKEVYFEVSNFELIENYKEENLY